MAVTLGLPTVSERVDLLHVLQSLRRLDQDAGAGALADADADRHRGGQSERAGTGDDENGDRRDQGVGERGVGTPNRPGGEGEDRHSEHRGHEIARHRVRQSLDGRAAALRFGDHAHDARQHGVGPHFFGAHDERAGSVHGSPNQLVAGLLRHRHRLARHHGFIDGAGAFHDVAIDGHAVAGPHTQVIADRYLIESNFLVLATWLHAKGGLGGQFEQGADRPAGLLAGAQFQHLPQ